jgi:hypothetical protein
MMNYAVEYRGRVKTKEKKGMEQIVSHHIYNRVFFRVWFGFIFSIHPKWKWWVGGAEDD